MRNAGLWVAICIAASSGSGCRRSGAQPDAGVPPPPDSGAPAPVELSIQIQYEAPDAGLVQVDLSRSPAEIEPTQRLEVATNIGLENYRVRLFDEVDRAMVSDDEAEDRVERLVYRIHLPAPLKPGHKYTLTLDAQTGASMVDTHGRLQEDRRIALQVSGEDEPDPPPPPPPKHKKRPTHSKRRR